MSQWDSHGSSKRASKTAAKWISTSTLTACLLLNAGQTSQKLQRPLLASEPKKGGFHEGGAPSRNSADVVTGYFGMRKISIGKTGTSAHPHILLNGEFVFQVIWSHEAGHACLCFRSCLDSAYDDTASRRFPSINSQSPNCACQEFALVKVGIWVWTNTCMHLVLSQEVATMRYATVEVALLLYSSVELPAHRQ